MMMSGTRVTNILGTRARAHLENNRERHVETIGKLGRKRKPELVGVACEWPIAKRLYSVDCRAPL